jgi:hypothetical protein
MSLWKYPSYFKRLPNNKNVKNWLKSITNIQVESLKQIDTEKDKFVCGYGYYGENLMNNIFWEMNNNLNLYRNQIIKRPLNRYLSMIDFIIERDDNIRKPIEVKTFIENEKNDNSINLIFNDKYFYLPSDIFLVELNERRDLNAIHYLEGREWTNYSVLMKRYYSDEFKNKVSLKVHLNYFDEIEV